MYSAPSRTLLAVRHVTHVMYDLQQIDGVITDKHPHRHARATHAHSQQALVTDSLTSVVKKTN